MSKLKFLFLGISLFMVYLAIRTSMQSDMFHLPPVVLNEPWFKATLVDFYFNITIISAWVIYKENNLFRSVSLDLGFYFIRQYCNGFLCFSAVESA